MVIQSQYLYKGYWLQPALTARKFHHEEGDTNRLFSGDRVYWNENRMLEFCGRKDDLVKIRGHKVELANIENTLHQLEFVRECAVTAPEVSNGERQVIAYLVTSSPEEYNTKQIRRLLAQRMPAYEVPSQFVFLETMPITASGKIDRIALTVPTTKPENEIEAIEIPKDKLERELLEIWKTVLGDAIIATNDDFFELGGHSLSMMGLLAQITSIYKVEIPINLFLKSPTISMLTKYIKSQKNVPIGSNKLNEKQKIASNQLEEEVVAIIKQATLTTGTNIYQDQKHQWLYQLIPYKIALKLLAFLFKNPIVQKTLWSDKVNRIEQFIHLLQSFSGRQYDKKEIKGISLFRNYLKGHPAIVSSSLSYNFKEVTQISGMENFHTARSKERGILLVDFHNTLNKKTRKILIHKLFNTAVMSVAGLRLLQTNKEANLKLGAYFAETNPKLLGKKFMSYQYNMARDILSSNGVVKIAGDGQQGTSSVPISLFGKKVDLIQGFAKLAIDTGATVLPMVSSLGVDGIITVKIHSPIYLIDTPISNAEQQKRLLEKYVEFWSEGLLSDPANYIPKRMERILNLPDFN